MASTTQIRPELEAIPVRRLLPIWLVGAVFDVAAVIVLPTEAAAVAVVAIVLLISAASAIVMAKPFRG
jgi:hypothetical protein